MLEIFFFPGPINRAFYAILASVKSWTAIKTGREMSLSMSLRENNYTSKIGKRRMSNREFLPLPALLYHSFRRFPTGPRSRSTIDRCRFSFFFFFDEIIRIIILILSRKLWTEKDGLLLSTVFIEKKNFLEMRYLYNFFNYSFELE